MTTLCGAWRNAKGFTRRSLHPENSTPNPQKGGYPAPSRVTFLTGAKRDFSNWRRHFPKRLSTGYHHIRGADVVGIENSF